jgi:hypothetical protein
MTAAGRSVRRSTVPLTDLPDRLDRPVDSGYWGIVEPAH